MASWQLPDELDARLRQHLAGRDVEDYVACLLRDQLNYEQDEAYRAEIDRQMAASEADIRAGRITDAREAMRRIADPKGIRFDR